jgi:geranylgeranyl reductase family protein
MIESDALIVGGGPAGSTCARALRQAGWNVLVIDRARFPRDKVCGGWLTPEVFQLLDLDPGGYRAAGLTLEEITGFRTGVLRQRSVDTQYPCVVSYAIRRYEFDEFLLRRAGVLVLEQTPLTSLRRDRGVWVANEEIRAPIVIGAGGHFCPVARRARDRGAAATRPIVAKEVEFPLNGHGTTVAPNTPELFFCQDLDGYGWCVRKGEYLNVGIGRRSNAKFTAHVNDFISFLEGTGRAPGASRLPWRGHAYLASGAGRQSMVADGLLLIGDAAGLAYPESGEGIRPAIESGILAARTLIAAGGRHRLENLRPYEASIGRLHPHVIGAPPLLRSIQTAIGRALLRSPLFTRHMVLDRWFLRRQGATGR